MPLSLTHRPKPHERVGGVMSEADAATFLGISAKKLRRLGYEKRGPKFVKIGRQHLFTRVALQQWLEDQAR